MREIEFKNEKNRLKKTSQIKKQLHLYGKLINQIVLLKNLKLCIKK